MRLLIKPKKPMSDREIRGIGREVGRIKDIIIIEVPDHAAERILKNVRKNVEIAEIDELEPLEKPPDVAPQTERWYYKAVNIDIGWKISTGKDVKIAILDTGAQASHPYLYGRLLAGWNSVRQNTDWNDINGHGTAVAGTSLAVAPDSRIIPVRVSDFEDGGAYNSDMARAIYWAADNGANIINMSYRSWTSAIVVEAARYAVQRNVFITSSAGNDGVDHGYYAPDYILVVGATGQDGRKTWWSDYGKYIDVTAPGENIYTSVLNGYDYVNGTSFSAPMTAGVAALMYRDTSLFDLEMRLRTNNSWNQNLGWGIIDAGRVVQPHSPQRFYNELA